MNRDYCIRCGVKLLLSSIKDHKRTCQLCIYKKHVATLQSNEYIDKTFTCAWSKDLYRRVITFLEQHEIAIKTKSGMLPKVALLFQAAEKLFDRPENMNKEWVEKQIAQWKDKRHSGAISINAFFVEEHIFSKPDKNEERIKALLAGLETLPQHYRQAGEVFIKGRVALRERQIKLQAQHPLTVRTIETDCVRLARLIRWLIANMPDLTG